MHKSLNEMSNEELWKLFPIIISDHDPEWKNRFSSEKILLEKNLNDAILHIHHIGSTAVPGLLSKPTIDVLIEIKDSTDITKLVSAMEKVGYICSPQPNNPPPHLMFLKGYTPEGFKGQTYHVHIRYKGDWNEIHFRNYLIGHSEAADQYAELKLNLKNKFEHDRDAYTNAKSDFIRNITALARKELSSDTNSVT